MEKKNASQIKWKLKVIYREIVTTNAKFEELDKHTNETISEFKHLLEKLVDKIEKEWVEKEATSIANVSASRISTYLFR